LGTLTNEATITGGQYGRVGVELARGSVLMNDAFVAGGQGVAYRPGYSAGNGGDGVYMFQGGMVTNEAGATIAGGSSGQPGTSAKGANAGAGVDLARGGGGTLTNAGIIIGGNVANSGSPTQGGNGGSGVVLTGGALVTNTGSIGGGAGGGYGNSALVGGFGGSGVVMGSSTLANTLFNSGRITGGNGYNIAPGGTATIPVNSTVSGGDGVYVGSGGTLINSGIVIAGTGVYVGAGGGAFTNKGTITGGDGITVASGGTVFNTGTVISGVGVYLAAGGTLTNAGMIAGGIYAGITADAVQFAAAGTLVVDPGASFIGQVAGHAGFVDALYLAEYGANNGTLTGLGTQFTDFSQITVAANASWTLTGANTIASGATLTELNGAALTDTGTLANDGAITLDPSTMTVAGLTGTGSVAIDAGSVLSVQTTIAAGEILTFSGSGGYLHLGTPDDVAGSVTNFSIATRSIFRACPCRASATPPPPGS
jgi:hypothetical protein